MQKPKKSPQCYQMDFRRLYLAGHETTVTALSLSVHRNQQKHEGLGLGVRTGFTNMFEDDQCLVLSPGANPDASGGR